MEPDNAEGIKSVTALGQVFTIQYIHTDNKHASAALRRNVIIIRLPRRWPEHERNGAAERLERKMLKRLTHPKTKAIPMPQMTPSEKKAFARRALPALSEKVRQLNSAHFNSTLGSIKIKGNLTNWGSCSPKNNINLNFSLLFLSEGLLDYVIIHELAHTKVHNHSRAFWRIVEAIMPDYKARQRELRKYLLTN